MQYFSPLSLLPADLSAATSPRELKLAKNRLMAEFELTGSTTITLREKEFTRNDILKLFDQLDSATDLSYHSIIASDPVLLHFLLHHEVPIGERFSLPDDKITPEFITWLSPYFSHAFKKAVNRIFRNVYPEEFETLIVQPFWMTDVDAWNAWNGVEEQLKNMIVGLEDITKSKFHTPAQTQKFAGYNIIWLLCNLPEERFSPFINNYAFELMQLAIKEFNNRKRDLGFEIIGYARSLKISEEMREALIAKEKEMRKIVSNKVSADNRHNTWWYVRIGLFVVYVLSRLATCNDHNY